MTKGFIVNSLQFSNLLINIAVVAAPFTQARQKSILDIRFFRVIAVLMVTTLTANNGVADEANANSSERQLRTRFTATPSAEQSITINLKWSDVGRAKAYKLVEKAPYHSTFLEKAIIDDPVESVASTHGYSFELPLPTDDALQVWQYKVVACIYHHKTLERLCESAAEFSETLAIELARDTPMSSMSLALSYQYDELGRLIKATDPQNGDRQFDYDAAGNRTQMYITDNAQN